MKTALLIDNTQLDGNFIRVKPAISPATVAENTSAENTSAENTSAENKSAENTSAEKSDASNMADRNGPNGYQFSQSEKPRTRILAEYLACGYHISDQIIEKGIEFDKSNGISAAFQGALRNFDQNFTAWDNKHHVTERARYADEMHHFLDHAKHAWNTIESYFEKALGTPKGLRLRQFYEDGSKDVRDVHNEARHLADLMDEKHRSNDKQSVECTCGTVSVV